jgi:glucose-1-phosphate thymidylyltransferase
MKAIIPTGGRGTRMRPITFSSNKHFIPVANKPLIYYPIETVVEAGIKEIGITYSPEGYDEAQKYLGDGSQWGIKITYCLQEKPAGLANIVQVCEEFIAGDKFVFHLGDNIFVDGIKDLVDDFDKSGSNALVTMMQVKDNRRLGVPFFDDKGNFKEYVEKPENPPNNFGIPGLYFFDSQVFEAFRGADAIAPSARGELEVGSLYNWLMAHEFKVDAKEYTGKWLDPGKYDDWLESNQYILDKQVTENIQTELDESVSLENRVEIGKNCDIFNTRIRGPVRIANGVTIHDSYIGPFTAIAEGCKIEGAHVENSVLMPGVSISNVSKNIDTSLIGVDSEISGNPSSHAPMKLFIGEKCHVEV